MKTFVKWVPCVAALATLVAAQPALACSVCGCGDPLLSAQDPAALSGSLRFQVDSEYLNVKAGNETIPALQDNLDQYSLKLGVVYSPLERLSLIATLPYTWKNLSTGGVTGSNLSGIGDVEIGARLTLLDLTNLAARSRQALAISAGTSLPTGNNDAHTAGGERVDEHGQIGTGSWGPYAGLHYRFEQDRLTAFASVTGRLRTTNGDGYHYGNALLWSVHGQYRPWGRVAFDLGVDARHAAADTHFNAPESLDEIVVNTGGTVLAAAPAVYLNAAGPFWLALRAQIPFFSRLHGDQSVGPTVNIGVQYLVF
jgi:hypothetical protein